MYSITLKRWEPEEDFKLMEELYASPEYGEFFRRFPPDCNRSELLQLESTAGVRLYAIKNDQGVTLGFFSISGVDPNNQSANYGFVIHKDFQNQVVDGTSLAYLAFISFHNFIFSSTLIRKLTARILSKREEFVKNLVRNGYIIEGNFKESVFYRGGFEDETELSIFRRTFEELNGRV